MKIISIALLVCTFGTTLLGASFRDDFAVVLIDAASEAKYGTFPLERSILAQAVRQADKLQARGVVLKFFYDQPKTEASDLLLASSMTNLPVVLQARIDDTEAHPNPLPARSTLPEIKAQTRVSGKSGWIPLPRLAANARDIGFVDFTSTEVPLLETYQNQAVKSLVLCCIELATGTKAVIEPGRRVSFGSRTLGLDTFNCIQAALPSKDDLAYLPFDKFLAGDIPANQIHNKVVIIGYDGPQIHSISTSIGPVRAHRFFIYALQSIYEQPGI